MGKLKDHIHNTRHRFDRGRWKTIKNEVNKKRKCNSHENASKQQIQRTPRKNNQLFSDVRGVATDVRIYLKLDIGFAMKPIKTPLRHITYICGLSTRLFINVLLCLLNSINLQQRPNEIFSDTGIGK